MPSPAETPRRRAALVVAHPGHELRVHGLCERHRPLVCVLTDGSGSGARSRLAETTALLARLGATPGPIYGRLTDRELYAALLHGEHERLVALAAELAGVLREARIEVVAGDAAEGFNPGHDLCRLLVNAAVARLAAEGAPPIANLEFPLDAAPEVPGGRQRSPRIDTAAEAGSDSGSGSGSNQVSDRASAEVSDEVSDVLGRGCRLVLDDAALARKLAAARAYAGLESEVGLALDRHGADAFRVERLRPVAYGLDLAACLPDPPAYERYGEERVASGRYAEVLRFRRHLAPAAERLRAFAAGAAP